MYRDVLLPSLVYGTTGRSNGNLSTTPVDSGRRYTTTLCKLTIYIYLCAFKRYCIFYLNAFPNSGSRSSGWRRMQVVDFALFKFVSKLHQILSNL